MYFSNNKRVQTLLKFLVFLRSSPYKRKHTYVKISNSNNTIFHIITLFSVIGFFFKMVVFNIHIGTTIEKMSSLVPTLKYLVFMSFRIFQSSKQRNEEVVNFMKQMEKQESVLLENRKCKSDRYFCNLHKSIIKRYCITLNGSFQN